MLVINHNWSATKQRPHPQSVAEISRHSVLSGDRIRQCGTSSGSRHKDTDQCLKSPFPSAGTAMSLFRAKTVQQKLLLPREVETRLPDCRGSHTRWELTTWADFQLCLYRLLMSTGFKSSHNGFLDVSCSKDSEGCWRRHNWLGCSHWPDVMKHGECHFSSCYALFSVKDICDYCGTCHYMLWSSLVDPGFSKGGVEHRRCEAWGAVGAEGSGCVWGGVVSLTTSCAPLQKIFELFISK